MAGVTYVLLDAGKQAAAVDQQLLAAESQHYELRLQKKILKAQVPDANDPTRISKLAAINAQINLLEPRVLAIQAVKADPSVIDGSPVPGLSEWKPLPPDHDGED